MRKLVYGRFSDDNFRTRGKIFEPALQGWMENHVGSTGRTKLRLVPRNIGRRGVRSRAFPSSFGGKGDARGWITRGFAREAGFRSRVVWRGSFPRAMADLREGLLAPRGASEGDDDDSAVLDDPNGDDATGATPWTAAATATISLTMTAVGSVVLSLPATFAECGWLAGTCVLALVALLVDASLLFVVYAARSARARSYEEARARPARTHRRRVRRGGAHRARLREPGQPADHRRRPGPARRARGLGKSRVATVTKFPGGTPSSASDGSSRASRWRSSTR